MIFFQAVAHCIPGIKIKRSTISPSYPQERKIIVSIADFGVGIPETVRRIEGELPDSQAIIRASEDGFSSMSIPTNMGAGLHYLIQNIVENSMGRVVIRSLSGLVSFENQSGRSYARTMIGSTTVQIHNQGRTSCDQ